MKSLGFAALVASGLFALAPPSLAAEPCAAALSANNPAFGPPRSCATAPGTAASAKPSKGTSTTPRKVETVTSAGGKTIYRYDDTTIAVGGYVAADMITGRGRPRP